MDNDLGVGARPKNVAERSQLRHQRLKIIDLAVVNDANRAVLVELRLVTGHQIDNGEPAVPQPDPRRIMETVAIGSAMIEDIGHPS